jgi:hypothetical protein
MEKIDEIAEGCVKEATEDYVGLWQISTRVRREFRKLNLSDEQVKMLSLEVVRLIVDRGLLPGDYLKTGFYFWDEHDPASIIARIDREWNLASSDPTLANPICWFDIQRQ